MTAADTARPLVLTPAEAGAAARGELRQVRRALDPQPTPWTCNAPGSEDISGLRWRGVSYEDSVEDDRALARMCPVGAVGATLWCREAAYVAPPGFGDTVGLEVPRDNRGHPRVVGYAASMDGDSVRCAEDYGIRKRSASQLPRWASRFSLRVLAVRVERLTPVTWPRDARMLGRLPEAGEAAWHWVVDVDVEDAARAAGAVGDG